MTSSSPFDARSRIRYTPSADAPDSTLREPWSTTNSFSGIGTRLQTASDDIRSVTVRRMKRPCRFLERSGPSRITAPVPVPQLAAEAMPLPVVDGCRSPRRGGGGEGRGATRAFPQATPAHWIEGAGCAAAAGVSRRERLCSCARSAAFSLRSGSSVRSSLPFNAASSSRSWAGLSHGAATRVDRCSSAAPIMSTEMAAAWHVVSGDIVIARKFAQWSPICELRYGKRTVRGTTAGNTRERYVAYGL
eukprot:6663469-Prymnesium_polylepis.1